MKGMFGLIGLIVVLGIVAFVLKSQLASTRDAESARSALVISPESTKAPVVDPLGDVRQQSQNIQQQYKQSLEQALQAPRPQVEDK